MWQPNRAQWRIIWFAAVLAILAWPSDCRAQPGVKALNRLVDPAAVPELPPPLPCRWETTATP